MDGGDEEGGGIGGGVEGGEDGGGVGAWGCDGEEEVEGGKMVLGLCVGSVDIGQVWLEVEESCLVLKLNTRVREEEIISVVFAHGFLSAGLWLAG